MKSIEPLLLEVLSPKKTNNCGNTQSKCYYSKIICVRLFEPIAIHSIMCWIQVFIIIDRHKVVIKLVVYNTNY